MRYIKLFNLIQRIADAAAGSRRIAVADDGIGSRFYHAEFGPRPGDVVVHKHWARSGFANTPFGQNIHAARL